MSAPTRPRAAHLGPAVRRPLVLDAALAVFREHGYAGASMDAIAREAGVSKPVVYDCFDGKEELFAALLEREEQRVLGAIAAALPNAADGDLESMLAQGLGGFLRAVEESPDVYRVIVLGEGGGDAAFARRIQRGRRQQADAIAALARAWLQSVGAKGDLDASARLLGQLSVGLAEAAARALLDDPEAWTAEALARRVAKVATRGAAGL